ncbi:MAG TPA: DoxX family protein [Flavisolibacter sp.]|nr:DoxX family protein [Flavisolibacter sp.]
MSQVTFPNEQHVYQVAWALIRVGIGITFIIHGYPKITGGIEVWTWLGDQMKWLGIDFWKPTWGFLAAVAELGGGILLTVGILTRPAALLLFLTMVVAFLSQLFGGMDYNSYSHSLKLLFVFAAFVLAGGGNYSLDVVLQRRKQKL